MLNLTGIFNQDDVAAIRYYTKIRFDDASILSAPEALTLYEEGYLTSKEIKSLCESHYGIELYEPIRTYVPEDIVASFRGTGAVPVAYEPMSKRLTLVVVKDLPFDDNLKYLNFTIDVKYTTLNYYFKVYGQAYGQHPCLREMPAQTLFQGIVREAVNLGAIDITINSESTSTSVFYNARKKRIDSTKIFSKEFIYDLIEYLTIKSPMDKDSAKPKDLDVSIDKDYRGRVQINPTIYGFSITIRLLPNATFNTTMEELNLSEKTRQFIETAFYDKKPGLRLMVGATMAGKNTTLLTVISELAKRGDYKIVSIEMPVEQHLPGIIQINAQKEEEFKANIESMIKANPDFLYVTEIRDSIGLPVVNVTNTGKCVFSTLHSNSVSATISRLIDITGLTQDRVIQTLHSICYQELVRDDKEDKLYPRDRFLWFTDELKARLYGKTLGEVISIINEAEDGD